MGKGKSEQYVVCQNPKCRPFENPRHRAWRYVSRGRDACQFCSTPFRVPVAASGSPAGEGWKSQDAKGRTIPAAGPATWAGVTKGTAKPQPGKPPVGSKALPEEDELAQMYRAKYKDDPEKLRQLDEIFPPPPRTQADIIREALAAVEKAQASENHICKVCDDMDAAYLRKAEELLQYQQKIEEHKAKKESAKQALKQAKQELAKVQADAAPTDTPSPFVPNEDPVALLATYNPLQGIATALQAIDGASQVPHEVLQQMQAVMQDQFKVHLNLFAQRLVTSPPSSSATSLHRIPAAPAAASVSTGADGCSDLSDPTLVVDMSMSSVVGVKRSAEELAREGLEDDQESLDLSSAGFDNTQTGARSHAQLGASQADTQANAQAIIQSALTAANAATAAATAASASQGHL